MTIIVTGGAGFIGSNFVFHMLNKYPDYRIVCLDCLTYAGNLSTLAPVMDNPNFRFVKESITAVSYTHLDVYKRQVRYRGIAVSDSNSIFSRRYFNTKSVIYQ